MVKDTVEVPRTVVVLGNRRPQMLLSSADGVVRTVDAEHLDQAETRVVMRPGFDDPDHVELSLSTPNDRMLSMIGRELGARKLERYAVGVNELERIVDIHAAGELPAYVWAERDGKPETDFAEAIAHHFGCPVMKPTLLLTNAGRDALHAQHLSTSAQPAAFDYLALANSSTATTPNVTDTSLTGEITTAGGGLIRGIATYAHTGGTNTSTLTKTFTANGSDVIPVTASQAGVFNATSAGTLGYKTALSSNVPFNVIGDSGVVTWTDTVG